ncbi:MAG: DNA-binding protein [Cyanobacteria bacterium SBLK]|nr:DNA-binding protein [Cyanobacteria bacterium SBLK]
MNEYDFTLKFALPDDRDSPDDFVESLYAGGCDDALIGVGTQGYIALNFIREASSAYEAISSAIADVKKVIPSVTFIEASPDLVSLADIARILGCDRENLRGLIQKSHSTLPLSVYEGIHSIWHLAEILIWLHEEKIYSIDRALLEVAQINMSLNIARGWQRIDADIQDNIKSLAV